MATRADVVTRATAAATAAPNASQSTTAKRITHQAAVKATEGQSPTKSSATTSPPPSPPPPRLTRAADRKSVV